MAYSMRVHISYILETNYKRPFSLTRRKPNEILQLNEKTYGIKFKAALNLKFMPKWRKNNQNNKSE